MASNANCLAVDVDEIAIDIHSNRTEQQKENGKQMMERESCPAAYTHTHAHAHVHVHVQIQAQHTKGFRW